MRSRKAAIDRTVDRLQRVALCVTDRPVMTTGGQPPRSLPRFAFAPTQQAAPLGTTRGRRGLFLAMTIFYNVVDSAFETADHVQVAGYRYAVLDRQDREIIEFHWHPAGSSPITYPHLHLSGRLAPLDLGPGIEPIRLGEIHLPTAGMITLADVVRLLITELGVGPRRADWERVLAEAGG